MSIQPCSTSALDELTRRAAQRMASSQPVWECSGTAGELLDLPDDVLLHAGPPLPTPDLITPPMLHAACAALLFESRANSYPEACELMRSGAVRLCPAQDMGVVTPLAAIVSRSMWLHRVVDTGSSTGVGYAPLSDGIGPAQRFGLCGPEVVERLRLVHEHVAPALQAAWTSPLEVLPLARESLARGDETHARVGVGSRLLGETLSRLSLPSAVAEYLIGNPQGFLNLWMAACRCMVGAALDGGAGMLVVAAGGNGVEFGIQRGNEPGRWYTAAAAAVIGPALRPELENRRRLPAIGDSALIDAVGFGALALDAAPEHAALLGNAEVLAALERTSARITVAMHPVLGRPIGINARVVDADCLPAVCLAALDAEGELGIIGRGLARHPLSVYG